MPSYPPTTPIGRVGIIRESSHPRDLGHYVEVVHRRDAEGIRYSRDGLRILTWRDGKIDPPYFWMQDDLDYEFSRRGWVVEWLPPEVAAKARSRRWGWPQGVSPGHCLALCGLAVLILVGFVLAGAGAGYALGGNGRFFDSCGVRVGAALGVIVFVLVSVRLGIWRNRYRYMQWWRRSGRRWRSGIIEPGDVASAREQPSR